jgi:hypothetical protein
MKVRGKVILRLIKNHTMKMDVQLHAFLISAYDNMSGQLHTPAALQLRESVLDTQWIRGWVGPRASLIMAGEENISTLAGN